MNLYHFETAAVSEEEFFDKALRLAKQVLILSDSDAWLNPRIDAVVVSEEMFTAADIANRQRRKLGLRTFSIQVMAGAS